MSDKSFESASQCCLNFVHCQLKRLCACASVCVPVFPTKFKYIRKAAEAERSTNHPTRAAYLFYSAAVSGQSLEYHIVHIEAPPRDRYHCLGPNLGTEAMSHLGGDELQPSTLSVLLLLQEAPHLGVVLSQSLLSRPLSGAAHTPGAQTSCGPEEQEGLCPKQDTSKDQASASWRRNAKNPPKKPKKVRFQTVKLRLRVKIYTWERIRSLHRAELRCG